MTEQKIIGYKGTLRFTFSAEDRAEYGQDRSFKVEGSGRCWEVWLPGEPTYGMPDELTPDSIDPWDESMDGIEVVITREGVVWNYMDTDYGILWRVIPATSGSEASE